MRNWQNETLQTVFNHVARHLMKQGRRSHKLEMMDLEGRRCAIGCLIPKEEYFLRDGRYDYVRNPLSSMYGDHYLLINDLMQLHDYGPKPSRWPAALRKIAFKYGLKFPGGNNASKKH